MEEGEGREREREKCSGNVCVCVCIFKDKQYHTEGRGGISTPEYSSALLPCSFTTPRRKRILQA